MRATRIATDPKPSPDLAVALALPVPPGRLRSPPAAPGPRSRASVPESWRRTGAGHAPGGADPPQRPDPCRTRWRHSSIRGRRSPSWPPAVPRVNFDPLHGAIQFRLQSPLRCLSEASIPPIAFSRLEPEDLYAQLACTGSSRKSRRTTSRLRATVHRWPSPSGPAGKAWPGETVDEPSSPAFTTGPSTATKIIGHVPVLLGHFD